MKVLFLGNNQSILSVERFNLLKDFKNIEQIDHLDSVKQKNIFIKIIYYIVKFIKLNFIILFNKYDVVIFHGAYHFILNIILVKDVKVVVIPQGSEINEQYVGHVKYLVDKLLIRSNLILARSLIMKKTLLKNIIGIENKVSIINWGIDNKFFANEIKRPNDKISIISYRATGKIYNIDLIFLVIEKLKLKYNNINFIYIEYNKDYAVDLNLKIVNEYFSNITKTEVASILCRSDLSLSIPTYDGFSNSILETLASGCYPIISDIKAYDSIFPEDNYLLRKTKINFDVLYSTIEETIININNIRVNTSKRREFAFENYQREKQIDNLKKLINNL